MSLENHELAAQLEGRKALAEEPGGRSSELGDTEYGEETVSHH